MNISDEAVEALARVLAMESLIEADMDGYGFDHKNDDPEQFMDRERARRYLEAATPHILAQAWDLATASIIEHGNPFAPTNIDNPYRTGTGYIPGNHTGTTFGPSSEPVRPDPATTSAAGSTTTKGTSVTERNDSYLDAPLYAPSKAQLAAAVAKATPADAWDDGYNAGAYDQHHLAAANDTQEKPRPSTRNPYK